MLLGAYPETDIRASSRDMEERYAAYGPKHLTLECQTGLKWGDQRYRIQTNLLAKSDQARSVGHHKFLLL